METKFILYIASVIGFICIIYFIGSNRETVDHPALNTEAETPDIYLKNATIYTFENEYDRGLYHLEKAIGSIEKIETDVDSESNLLLDGAISKLQSIVDEFKRDSIVTDDMRRTFEYSLNTLAIAELRVSETYVEADRQNLSKLALKHAKMHIKNAMWHGSSRLEKTEKHVLLEIDSLIANQSLPTEELMKKIDEIINEMNEMID